MGLNVQDITDIIQTVAAVAVAWPAMMGLTTWRKQLIGRKKIELAEEVLTLAYTLQGVIEWARHPVSFGGEGQERPGRDEEPEARQRLNDSYYSRISRLSDHEDDFAKLRLARMRFRAYFGDRGQDALETFGVTRTKISNAVRMLINQAGDEPYPQDLRRRMEDRIWDTSTENEPDEIRQQVNDAITEIEGICRPILTKG